MGAIEDLRENADTLVDFATNPLGFIRKYVFVIIASGFLAAYEQVIYVMNILYSTVKDTVFVQSGTAIAESLAAVGSIPFLILESLNAMLVTGAQAGGPFAPLIFVFAWTVLLIAVVEGLRFAWKSFVVVT